MKCEPSVCRHRDHERLRTRSFFSNVVIQQDDPAFKRIAFIGLPQEMEHDARIKAMEQFTKQNFLRIRIKDCIVFRGPRARCAMTQTGYIEVSSFDVKNKWMDQIDSRSLKCVIGGHDVRLARARSLTSGKRNATLKQALDTLRKGFTELWQRHHNCMGRCSWSNC